MRIHIAAVMVLGTALSVAAQEPAQVPAQAERYVVVRECDYHNAERCAVMSETDYRKRIKEVAAEADLIAKAMQDARNDWQAEDRERVDKLRDQARAQANANAHASCNGSY